MLLIIQIKLTIGACQIFKKEELMQVFATAIVHQRQNIWGIQEHLKLSNRLQIQNIQEVRQYCYNSLSAGQTQSRALCTVQWIGLTTIWKLRINTLIVQVKKMGVGYTAHHQVSSHSVTDSCQSVYSFAWSWLITDECVLQRDYQPVWVIWGHHRAEEPRREAGLAKAPGNSQISYFKLDFVLFPCSQSK